MKKNIYFDDERLYYDQQFLYYQMRLNLLIFIIQPLQGARLQIVLYWKLFLAGFGVFIFTFVPIILWFDCKTFGEIKIHIFISLWYIFLFCMSFLLYRVLWMETVVIFDVDYCRVKCIYFILCFHGYTGIYKHIRII